MSEKRYCDWCSTELGEVFLSNNKGGSYCSVQCTDADEEIPQQHVTVTAQDIRWNPEKVIDMLAALSEKVVELERKLDGLGVANERAYKRVADRVEESASNIVTLSQELATKTKEIDDKVEMALGDIVTLDERTQPTQLSKALAALDRMERRGR